MGRRRRTKRVHPTFPQVQVEKAGRVTLGPVTFLILRQLKAYKERGRGIRTVASNFAWLFAGATLTACNPEGSHNLVIAIEGVWLRVRGVPLHLSLVEQAARAW